MTHRDPIDFIEGVLIDPETGRPFVLTEAQRLYLRHAFALTPDGRLRHPELVFSAPKKSGKTGFAAMVMLYVVCALGGKFAEGYCAANDFEQSQGRVFQATARIVAASPLLAADATITQSKITFASTGATITAIASDFAGAAGANPTITAFDELWGYTSERAHRLFDEMAPPPTRKIACRLTTTYAGFEGESALLESLYKRGLKGAPIAPDLYDAGGLLMYWTHGFTAPWQTEAWREEMRENSRPNAFLRLVENRWVTTESTFVDMAWWDECTDPEAHPILHDRRLPIAVGIDASMTNDTTAIVATTWDHDTSKVKLVWHRIWHPSPDCPIDFEDVAQTVEVLAQRFDLRVVRFDPYQMQAVSQRLTARCIPMVAFNQTVPNITEASTNLYDLIKSRNLIAYPDDEIRLAVQRAVAVEVPRGWKITKAKTSHKIDVVVALGMSALGAVEFASQPLPIVISQAALARARAGSSYGGTPWPPGLGYSGSTSVGDQGLARGYGGRLLKGY